MVVLYDLPPFSMARSVAWTIPFGRKLAVWRVFLCSTGLLVKSYANSKRDLIAWHLRRNYEMLQPVPDRKVLRFICGFRSTRLVLLCELGLALRAWFYFTSLVLLHERGFGCEDVILKVRFLFYEFPKNSRRLFSGRKVHLINVVREFYYFWLSVYWFSLAFFSDSSFLFILIKKNPAPNGTK